MKKTRLTALILAAALLCGCENIEGGTETATDAPAESTVGTTAPVINAVENQPERSDTAAENEDPDDTENPDAQGNTSPIDKPDGFPAPYPVAREEDEEMLTKFKEIIGKAEVAESVLYGKDTLIALSGEEKDGYKQISTAYASDMDELIERMYEGFKYSFWEDEYDKEIETMLPDIIRETDSGLMLKLDSTAEVKKIEVESAVLHSLTSYDARVVALGSVGDKYIWRTYKMLNGVRGWVVMEHSDEEVTGEVAVFNQLLIDKQNTLDKIFGNADPVKDDNGDWNPVQVTIDNDVYGHGFYNGLEVEHFMSIEEMRQFVRDTFTEEIANSYISLYINRTYVEKDGRLYIISGSILPEMGEFNLDNYENRTISSFDVTSMVDWTDGRNDYRLPMTIAYEDGLWKIDTRLPMKADRVLE
ncbi:MAG: hypothetical protein NC203_02710 [Firmicutes bacterium]|nr:hypothetical protein [[Eubacterium] siraeum]MCM1487256.1 hypothetical protein [Bacillota bacterium]